MGESSGATEAGDRLRHELETATGNTVKRVPGRSPGLNTY